jgi:DNA replication protein DnaC
MSFDIDYAMLPDDEAERLYNRIPELRSGVCPTCRGQQTYRWGGEDIACECRHQIQLAKHYSASGIGVTYQRLDWGDYKGNPETLDQVGDYLLNHERILSRGIGLMLYGRPGLGKTMLATLVLKELIRRGYTCYATTFANTIESFTATWGNPEEKQWFAKKFMHSQVLLLDDLGQELRTSNTNRMPLSTFDSILRSRVQDGRPTLLTTNMTLDEMDTGFGAATLSLLREVSINIEFTGSDYRPQVKERTLAEAASGEIRPIV